MVPATPDIGQPDLTRLAGPPGRDDVLGALEHQATRGDAVEVGAVVGEEGGPGEVLRYLGVGTAEAVGQLVRQLRPVGVAHDGRRHRARPAHVVAVEKVEQLVHLRLAKAADVVRVVDVAWRGPNQDEVVEELRRALGGEHADHGAHRVADEHAATDAELAAELDDVAGVALEGAVFRGVVGG